VISWGACGIAKIGQRETAANNNDVSRPFPPVTRVHGGAEEKQERETGLSHTESTEFTEKGREERE